MTETVQTLLNQLGGANKIAAMTDATIVTDNNAATLVFRKQVGTAGQKLTHLKVTYNEVTDLYDLAALKLNKRTFEMQEVKNLTGLYGDQIKGICEKITGLYFTF